MTTWWNRFELRGQGNKAVLRCDRRDAVISAVKTSNYDNDACNRWCKGMWPYGLMKGIRMYTTFYTKKLEVEVI